MGGFLPHQAVLAPTLFSLSSSDVDHTQGRFERRKHRMSGDRNEDFTTDSTGLLLPLLVPGSTVVSSSVGRSFTPAAAGGGFECADETGLVSKDADNTQCIMRDDRDTNLRSLIKSHVDLLKHD
jgi:hypothetical protein